MGEHIRNGGHPHANGPVSLGELIHVAERQAIERAAEKELAVALGAAPYERRAARRGYRNGTKAHTLTGPTGPLVLTLPRGSLFTPTGGATEWASTLVPRYERRLYEVNEAIVATHLAGGNTRWLCRALGPMLKEATLSKSAVSRIVTTLREGLQGWSQRPLRDLDGLSLPRCPRPARPTGRS